MVEKGFGFKRKKIRVVALRKILLIVACMILLCFASTLSTATSVNLLFMTNLEGYPGDTIIQEIQLTGNQPDRIGHWRTSYKHIEGEDETRMDIRSWITITPENYTLAQGEVKTFTVAIRIPKDSEPGLYGATSTEAGLIGHSGERRTFIVFEDADATLVKEAQGNVAYTGLLLPISVNVSGGVQHSPSASPSMSPTPIPRQIPTPAPEETSTPTPYPFAAISPVYLIGAAALAIVLIVGFGISHKGKGGPKEELPIEPKPPAEPPKPPVTPSKPKAETQPPEPPKPQRPVEPEPKVEATKPEPEKPSSVTAREQMVTASSAVNYNRTMILYKVKVENKLSKPISDIKVKVFVPDVFLLKVEEKTIAILEPNNARTVTFEIRPTGECGDCNISGRVTYYNYLTDKREEIEISVKSVSIICPLLKACEITEEAWRRLISSQIEVGESTKEELPIGAKSLFSMVSDIVKDLNLYKVVENVTENLNFFRGVARFYGEGVKGLKYAAQIEAIGGTRKSQLIIKAWAEREDALIGFYYKILDEIEKRIQVKSYIEDSIVQQFYHIGDKIGTVIKDSVVQRSTIISNGGKKCPHCGKEVSEDEKFCPECGEKLR